MARPYSYDLRELALSQIDAGEYVAEVSRRFNISRDTLYRWLKRRNETGDIRAKKYTRHKPTKLMPDEKFYKFVEKNKTKTLKELVKLWPVQVSLPTMSKALKKLGYTRKKRLIATKNGKRRIVYYFLKS